MNSTITSVLLLVILLVGCILVLNWVAQPTMSAIEWQEETYRVKSGDSLWIVSGNYCPENIDRREWIAEVQELNGLKDSIIYPGQTLKVLAPNK